MTSPSEQDLGLQILSLQRRLRLLSLVLLLTVAGLTVALFRGNVIDDRVRLSVRSLELVDEEGRARAVLQITESGPEFALLDEDGGTRVSLVQQADQDGLFVQDANGDVRVGAAQFAHGGGGFALHGPNMKGGAVLYLKGEGSLSFFGSDGKTSLRLPERP
jgi:hypothetical protein